MAPAAEGAGPGLQRGGGPAAIAAITAPLSEGNGWRHIWVGTTGAGKTWATRELIMVPGQLVLIHDDAKARPEYPDHALYLAAVTDLEQVGDKNPPAIAFRGDPYAGITCPVEDVAALALRMARGRLPVRLVVDEMDQAVSDGGRKLEAPSLRACFVTGRTMGLSVVCNVQQPQRMPEVASQASSVGFFRLEPAALAYVAERFSVDPEIMSLVPHLPNGDFVLHRPGFPWDRRIYRF